jgi:hypothetical protein
MPKDDWGRAPVPLLLGYDSGSKRMEGPAQEAERRRPAAEHGP